MPSHSKRNSIPPRDRPSPLPDDLLLEEEYPEEQSNTARLGKKRSKNATVKATDRSLSRERLPDEVGLPQEELNQAPASPTLHQIPRAFPQRTREPLASQVADLSISQKVSDEHTPPREQFIPPPSSYGRSPPTDVLPGFVHAGTPPTHPGYLDRGGFSTRSPPNSPPQVKVRPVSFGGRPPSVYGGTRASPALYPYQASAYGSPPNLPPHLPQQHFYHAQDLHLSVSPAPAQRQSPSLIKRSALAAPARSEDKVILLGFDGELDVLIEHENACEILGSLRELPGMVVDAVFLSWSEGPDPLRDQRPLVVVALDIQDPAPERPQMRSRPVVRDSTLAVAVYSLQQQNLVAELLTVPMSVVSMNSIKLEASGNFFAVSLGKGGETFVFALVATEDECEFVCLTKVWTALQPHMQRRDSSHARATDTDASPADSNRGQPSSQQPISSLNDRWLAYCPTKSDVRSTGALLGEHITQYDSAAIARTSPGSQPIVTATIDTPDAPTLIGRLAKGAAQGIIRGADMARERGMQLWRDYWNPDNIATSPSQNQTTLSNRLGYFPPTHAETDSPISNEPEMVAILDLKDLYTRGTIKAGEIVNPVAVFQPLGGCSFLSFTPSGVSLFTASRKGDMQYIWDLFQMRHIRSVMLPQDQEAGQLLPRVRQIAKYERVTPSVIVDIEWDGAIGKRFTVLTQNRTIHLFDVPAAAFRWPPPRSYIKQRPTSAIAEKSEPTTATSMASGFFASAKAFAGSAQPMLANFRGRAPSASRGAPMVPASGLGMASATSVKGGKVVAASFSKSLGAATDTVAHIRHAGQSRIRLQIDASAGRMAWRVRKGRPVLTVLEANGVRYYNVRKTNPRERQSETVSVFEAIPPRPEGIRFPTDSGPIISQNSGRPDIEPPSDPGFWKPQAKQQAAAESLKAPLGQAEIETNAPYQPFHSDQRVTMSVYSEGHTMAESQYPTASVIFQPQTQTQASATPAKWVFGGDIPTRRLDLGRQQKESGRGGVTEIVRETTKAPSGNDAGEQLVSTTTKRRRKKLAPAQGDGVDDTGDQEHVFEGDMDFVDFATEQV